jgi:hypothetical protein
VCGGGGVKKCFLGLWQTALLSAEGKKKQPRTFTASELTSKQKENGPDWTDNERLVSKKMKKKRKQSFSGTSADVRWEQPERSNLLPLPERGSHFCSQGHRLLLLLLSLSPAESDRQLLSTPPPSSSSRTRQLLPPRVKKKKRRAAKGKRPAEGKQLAEAAAQAQTGAAALLRRAARVAKAAATAERPEHWLGAWTNMGVAIYGRNNELLVAGCKQELSEEDPAAVANCATVKPMPQPTTNTRSSQYAGPPENNHGLLEVLTGRCASSSSSTAQF